MKKETGFTLIEILLVIVIVSMIIIMGIGYMQQQTEALRVDKTSLQMQQVLNAGLAYYVTHSTWPNNIATLQTTNFLPSTSLVNPWGQNYNTIIEPNQKALFYVYTSVTGTASGSALASASIIAGKLPMAAITNKTPTPANINSPTACKKTDTTCYITASVNIPGQNLNNASAVNFAGVYHHGACIPAPTCPVDATGAKMQAQVFIVPISISGITDSTLANNYAITSFTAYPSAIVASINPVIGCIGSTNTQQCPSNAAPDPTTNYWRACVQIVTENGPRLRQVQQLIIGDNKFPWEAFTRCGLSQLKIVAQA